MKLFIGNNYVGDFNVDVVVIDNIYGNKQKIKHTDWEQYKVRSDMVNKIEIEFEKRFKMRNLIRIRNSGINTCCMYGVVSVKNIRPIFNLETKKKYYQKPTYESLEQSLIDMKKQCIALKVKLIAMPKIGCGLDKLKWEKVKVILVNVFKDMDIEILVCYL